MSLFQVTFELAVIVEYGAIAPDLVFELDSKAP